MHAGHNSLCTRQLDSMPTIQLDVNSSNNYNYNLRRIAKDAHTQPVLSPSMLHSAEQQASIILYAAQIQTISPCPFQYSIPNLPSCQWICATASGAHQPVQGCPQKRNHHHLMWFTMHTTVWCHEEAS